MANIYIDILFSAQIIIISYSTTYLQTSPACSLLSKFHLPFIPFYFISIIILIFKFYLTLDDNLSHYNCYMTSRLFALLLVAFCVFSASSFRLTDTVEFVREGFKQVTNKFGDKYWHRNHTDQE